MALAWGDVYLDNDTGNICKYFAPHQGQLDILNSSARFMAALGGVHSGKTSLGCLWLTQEIEKHGASEGCQYLIVGPTFGVILSSTLEAWHLAVKGTSLKGRMVLDKTNPHYKLGPGGIVYFKSSEATFEGLKPRAALLDEGADCSESCFFAVKRRLDGQGGRCLITSTPYLNRDWIIHDIIHPADDGNPLYFYRCFPSTANPAADKAAIEEAKRTLPPHEFEMYYEGKFTKPPGLVYDFTDADGESCFIEVGDDGLPPAAAYFGSIDWGGADPTVILVGLLTPDDKLFVFWESYRRNADILQTFERLTEWHIAFKKTTGQSVQSWFCDHRPENIRALRQLGLNAKPVKKGSGNSIAVGISMVQARIRTGRLKIVRSQCPMLREEGQMYRYPMADGLSIGNVPIPGNDHTLDALSYLVRGIDRRELARITHSQRAKETRQR